MARARAKEEGLDDQMLRERLPCSLEAVDHLGEMIIEGKCKLTSELRAAQRVPAPERRMISLDYLEHAEQNADQEQAEPATKKAGALERLRTKGQGQKLSRQFTDRFAGSQAERLSGRRESLASPGLGLDDSPSPLLSTGASPAPTLGGPSALMGLGTRRGTMAPAHAAFPGTTASNDYTPHEEVIVEIYDKHHRYFK